MWMVFIDLPRGEDGKKNRKHLGYFHDLGVAIETRKEAEGVRMELAQERLEQKTIIKEISIGSSREKQ